MQANLALRKPEIAMASPNATDTSVEATVIIPMTRRSTPDSVAPSLASRRSHLIETIRDHPAWTAYSIVHVRSTAPPTNQPIIPTEVVGSLNKPAS